MIKLEVSKANGIKRVEEFTEGVKYLGSFTDFFVGNRVWLDGWFGPNPQRENPDDTVGIEVGEKLFDYINSIYPIQ